MFYELINTLLLVGAIQGLVFSGFAFFSSRYKSISSFFLGMLILTFSLNLIQNYVYMEGLVDGHFYFKYVYLPVTPSYAAFFYCFVKYFLFPRQKVSKIDLLLFLPFFFFFIISLTEKVSYIFGFFSDKNEYFFYTIRIFQEIFSVIYSLVLLWSSFRLIRSWEKLTALQEKREPALPLRWLKVINIILICLCLYWIWPLYFEFFMEDEASYPYFYVLWVGLAITIYIFGHLGLYRYSVLQERKKLHLFLENTVSDEKKIPDSEQNEYIQTFERLIKSEERYLDNELSLDSIAKEMGINNNYLSTIINSELQVSFSDYVNKLRVERVKEFILNPEFKDYKLLSIGLEAGFNSKTTFNTVFKKFTGLTPSQYKKQYSESVKSNSK